MSYQCIDWSVGSAGMQEREFLFNKRTGQNVYFGVGSYGNDNKRAGRCYRITTDSVDRDLIVQVVNQGSDVADGNFDLMQADGGFGIFDACSSSSVPQYSSVSTAWGDIYGGWSSSAGCKNLPQYPQCGSHPVDDLQQMCLWSFRKGLRKEIGDSNPKILQMCEISCPDQLYEATGLHRSDESTTSFTCDGSTNITSGGILTRMMDCAKPSYAWAYNVNGPTYPGYEQVIKIIV